jgi:acetoin utilization deacetylase AcuC-like enzyme
MQEITSNFFATFVDQPKFRVTRHTLLVHARDYIQFPCRICGSTKVKGYKTYTTSSWKRLHPISLPQFVNQPKFRDTRHTLLVHARDYIQFPCCICGSTKYRNTRHTLLVHARDYIQFPCRIAGSTKVKGYKTYTTPVESLDMKKKRQGAFPK